MMIQKQRKAKQNKNCHVQQSDAKGNKIDTGPKMQLHPIMVSNSGSSGGREPKVGAIKQSTVRENHRSQLPVSAYPRNIRKKKKPCWINSKGPSCPKLLFHHWPILLSK